MSAAPDFVLVGNGLAPLIAARLLIEEGRDVLLLNPEADFFREDSELPFDPLLPDEGLLSPARFQQVSSEAMRNDLGPHYPGALEYWIPQASSGARIRDGVAPFVRGRTWVWLDGGSRLKNEGIDLEKLFVETADLGLKPQWHDGLLAMGKCPGFSIKKTPELLERVEAARGVAVPLIGDFDIARYRRGLLEFLRERMGPDRLISGAAVEWDADSVSYWGKDSRLRVTPREGMMVFWTPRLSTWLQQTMRARKGSILLGAAPKVRVWEHWSLVSREPIDPGFVGVFGDLCLWSGGEGDLTRAPVRRLTVLLRKAAEVSESLALAHGASTESFSRIVDFCKTNLGWDGLTVRSLRLRTMFDWEVNDLMPPLEISRLPYRQWVVRQADGPGLQVIRSAKQAVDLALKAGGAA